MKKEVLLTNDDGIDSPGIKAVFEVLNSVFDVTVIAPDCEKSGVGHSFTHKNKVYVEKINGGYAEKMYSVSGSPADCVKVGISSILTKIPDFVISGMNIGENSGISAHYSGTVAAAREGAFWNVKSYAFSICEEGMNFYREYAGKIPDIIDLFSRNYHSFLNINFPACNPSVFKGIKITRQSTAFFEDHYNVEDIKYLSKIRRSYSIYGNKIDIESDEEFDSRALLNGWITVTPLTVDSTDYENLNLLKEVEKYFKGANNDRR